MKKFFTFHQRLFAIFFIALCVFQNVSLAQAISISPGLMEIPSVFRGSSQKTSVTIGRASNEVGDLGITVSARGDAASALIFEPSFTIPAESLRTEFPFTIDASRLQNGSYEVPLSFILTNFSDPKTDTGNSNAVVHVQTGVTIIVKFTVSGEQVVSYTLNSARALDTELNAHSFLVFNISNTGNVDWRPQKADLSFIDQNDVTHVTVYHLAGDVFALIPPNQSSDQTIDVPQSLPEGTYTVSIDFFDNDAVVGTLKTGIFHVYPSGFLKQTGDLLSVTAKKNSFLLGEKIPLDAEFKNTGEVPVSAVLMTEVYKGTSYVDLIRGDDVTVGIGESLHLSTVIDLKEKGEYTLGSYIKYADKKSQSINIDVTVGSGNAFLDFVNSPVGLGAVVVFVLFIVLLVVLKRRKSHRSVPITPSPVVSAPVVAKVELPRTEESLSSSNSSSVERLK